MAALEIPTLVGFREKKFNIRHAQQVTPVGTNGFLQTINRTSPFWAAEFETKPLTGDAYDDAIVFLDALEGSMNTFLGYDPRRIMPKAYYGQVEGSNPWGATPRITAQSYSASTINLDQMTNGAIITKGDYISVKIDNIWYLFRAMQDHTVSGTTVSSLLVKPRPNIANFATTAIRYQRAVAEMKLIGEYEEDDSVESFPVFRFRAGQYINRVPA